MPALFARVKIWGPNETITTDDLNGEFNNILANLTPAGVDDLSTTIGDMQATFDPGNVGSENPPQSLAQEVQSLRSMVQKITGEEEWYIPPGVSLSILSASVSLSGTNNVISGSVDADDYQDYLSVTAASFLLTLEADTTNFVYTIQGTQYILDSNVTRTLTAGPSSGNTATINDDKNSGERSKILGEYPGTGIRLDSPGAEITSRVNELFAYSYTNGGITEISLGIIRFDGSTYTIQDAFRGYFSDDSGPTERAEIADSGTITGLRLNYIYINSAGALSASTSDPYVQTTEPAAPVVGDYWLNVSENKWYIYDGTSFSETLITLIGLAAVSDTQIEGVRALDFFKSRSPLCDIGLEVLSDTEVGAQKGGGFVNVDGITYNFGMFRPTWSIESDLDAGITEAASTYYFAYLKNDGSKVISDVHPYNREADLKAWYHPSRPWRCIGLFYNDSSSDISHAESFGSSSYIADNSIGAEKLKNLQYIREVSLTPAFALPRISNTLSVSVSGSGAGTHNSGEVNIVTTGRPVMLVVFGSAASHFITATGSSTYEFQYRKSPEDTWTSLQTSPVGLSDTIPSLISFAFLPAGQYQFRIQLNITTGDASIAGEMIALEV